jgi:hypothetical protein
MSVSAAYALRDRREGRAWGVAWQAVLRERARNRLSDENLGRAMNGCVEQIVKDGVVVAERRRHDNRLSMAVLTRLDKLADRADSDETRLLRAVSEDIEDFYDVLDAGGDADAFIEARRPKPPAPRRDPLDDCFRDLDEDVDQDLDNVEWAARILGADPLSDVDPEEIDVADLDPARRERWGTEGWIRAERSHYRLWLDVMAAAGRLPGAGECAAKFERQRRWFAEAVADALTATDGDMERVLDCLSEIADAVPDTELEEAGRDQWKPSTSSTSAPAPEEF